MYYEEKHENGKYYFRTTPDGKWHEIEGSDFLALRDENARLKEDNDTWRMKYELANEKAIDTIRELIENSERLAGELKMQDRISKENDEEFGGGSVFVDYVLARHTALMKQVKGE